MLHKKITAHRYLVPFILVTALFFLWGFARAILDVLNKHLQNTMGISISQSALIQVTTYLGYFLAALPAGIFIARYGYRRGVVTGLLLFGLGALLFVPGAAMAGFHAYLACLFLIGCGLVFLETAANPYVTELGPSNTATSRLNLSQAFNGLGGIFATFTVGQFFFANGGTERNEAIPYAVLGVVVLLVALVFRRVDLPEIKHDDEGQLSPGFGSYGRLLKHRRFVTGLLALLCYEVAEISINSYFIIFTTGKQWLFDREANWCLTASLFLFMIGRFLGSWLMSRISPQRMLALCALGSCCCMILVLADLGTVSLVALMANYLFESIMFPTIFSLAIGGLGSLTKAAGSLLMMTPIGGCGFLLMGIIADATHLLIPFFVPLLGFCVVLWYAVWPARTLR